MVKKAVPNNIKHIPKMDDFMKELLKERTKSNKLQVEAVNDKIQNKTGDIYRPLANKWQYLEELNATKDKTVDVDMEHLLSCTQQKILLLGKSLNIMMYYMRYCRLCHILSVRVIR